MSDESEGACSAYVDAAAEVTHMPLDADRRGAVTAVMTRIAGFAARLRDIELADEVEIAAVFTP